MDFKEFIAGKSVNGKSIPAFVSSTSASSSPSSYLYLMAGVHGDEIEGIHILKELFSWLKTQTAEAISSPNLNIVVVPIVNIDGFEKQTRVNARGVDLNRNLPTADWTPHFEKAEHNPGISALSEPENQLLLELFKKYHPYFVISFHSWKRLLNHNGPSSCEEVAKFLESFNSYPLAADVGYGTPGSLGTYLPEKHHVPVLTFEAPLLKDTPGLTLDLVWKENEKGLKALLQAELMTSQNILSNTI